MIFILKLCEILKTSAIRQMILLKDKKSLWREKKMEKHLQKYRKAEIIKIIDDVCKVSKDAAILLIKRLETDLKELKLLIKNS